MKLPTVATLKAKTRVGVAKAVAFAHVPYFWGVFIEGHGFYAYAGGVLGVLAVLAVLVGEEA